MPGGRCGCSGGSRNCGTRHCRRFDGSPHIVELRAIARRELADDRQHVLVAMRVGGGVSCYVVDRPAQPSELDEPAARVCSGMPFLSEGILSAQANALHHSIRALLRWFRRTVRVAALSASRCLLEG
jgi:hypothetical protein